MLRLNQIASVLLSLSILQFGVASSWSEQPISTCKWSGPSTQSLLSRRLPLGEMAGQLGSKIVPFLRSQGIPISFISKATGDSRVHIVLGDAATTREVLDEIARQVSGYRYGVFDDRLVLYPEGEGYDVLVEMKPEDEVKRIKALQDLLHTLKAKAPAVQSIHMPTLRGGGLGGTIYGDSVEVGGTRSVIEHLASLIQNRPSTTFNVLVADDGHLYFDFDTVPLLQKLDVLAPSAVDQGSEFNVEVKGTLPDGTVISPGGPECYVKYGVTDDRVLTIDKLGRVVARQEGVATIFVQYEGKSAQVDVQVK